MQYPDIDPVAFSLGPLQVHWYGLMYLVGIAGGWLLARHRARQPGSGWTDEEVGDLVFYVALGVVLGGRIGYVLFYMLPDDPGRVLSDPLSIFYVWQGGMSFHGGLLGVVAAVALFCRWKNKSLFPVLDFIAPMVPIGLGAGRLGNFINGELWGRVTDAPWGMVFPTGGPLPRHPSQLYEFLLEGVILFIVLWLYSARPRPVLAVAGLFTLLYGAFRFFVEFFRQPDEQFGFIAFDWLTMGMLLSLPMVIVGALVMFLAYRHDAFGKIVRNNGSLS